MRLKTGAAIAAAIVFSLAGLGPSFGLCTLCTATIRLDADLAACVAAKSADLQPRLAGTTAVLFVDLTDCASRGALPTGQSAEVRLDKRFSVDAESLSCLTAQIEALDETAMTPSHLFDLTRNCPV